MADEIVRLDNAAIADLFTSEQGMVGKELARRAVEVERMAKRLCPVGTPESTGIRGYAGGRLRSSITWSLARDARGLLALIGSNVSYAPFVEFGTRYMGAQPYLRPALRAAGR